MTPVLPALPRLPTSHDQCPGITIDDWFTGLQLTLFNSTGVHAVTCLEQGSMQR